MYENSSLTLPFFLRAGDKTYVKMFSLYWQEGRHYQKWWIGANKSVKANLVKLTFIFLVTSPQFTTSSPNPLSCHFSTNVLFFVEDAVKAGILSHHFELLLVYISPVRYVLHPICFSLVNLSLCYKSLSQEIRRV